MTVTSNLRDGCARGGSETSGSREPLQQSSGDRLSASAVPQQAKPRVCIIHAALGMSGAFVALQRQAELLADDAEFLLVIGRSNRISEEQLAPFARVVRLPLLPMGRSPTAFVRYLASLLYSAVLLRVLLKRERCSRVQMNCFTSHHGAVLRLLGFRGRIVTWIRSDPSRVGLVGKRSLALAHWCSDALVAVSDYVRRLLPWPDEAVLVYDPAREMPVVGPSNEPAFVHLANYSRMKAQDFASGLSTSWQRSIRTQVDISRTPTGACWKPSVLRGVAETCGQRTRRGPDSLRGLCRRHGSTERQARCADGLALGAVRPRLPRCKRARFAGDCHPQRRAARNG
jgi:hypothetical protein